MLPSEPTAVVSMSIFVLSSERGEEALGNKNSEDNRHVMVTILLVKNQLPFVFTLLVTMGRMDNSYYTISKVLQLPQQFGPLIGYAYDSRLSVQL
jgi:hypothetical protein